MSAKTMKAAYFPAQGKDLEVGEVPIPEPKPNEVRIKVHACGVCYSDNVTKFGAVPGVQYPAIPGHEVAGVVDALGSSVSKFTIGERVGVGWFGGACRECRNCEKNERIGCQKLKICGVSYNGGYAEYMVAPWDAVVRIPDDLSYVNTSPLLCAGITTFNSVRHQNILAGSLVAVQGVGGLGHLAIQFCAKQGFIVAAISGGQDKEGLAKQLGATYYINSSTSDPVQELQKLGGAQLIVCTAPDSKIISPMIGGLSIGGKLLLVAIPKEPLEIPARPLVTQKKSIVGWPSGDSRDTQETLEFSAKTGIRPMIEEFSLENAKEAFNKMLSNKARFRCVLVPGK